MKNLIKLKVLVVIVLLLTTSNIWAKVDGFPDGEYSLSELDGQFPYKHTPNIFSSSFGPYLKYSLYIKGNHFKLVVEQGDGYAPKLIYLGRLHKEAPNKIVGFVTGIALDPKDSRSGAYFDAKKQQVMGGGSNEYLQKFNKAFPGFEVSPSGDLNAGYLQNHPEAAILRLELSVNHSLLRRILTYRPSNVASFVEGTLKLWDGNLAQRTNTKIQIIKSSNDSAGPSFNAEQVMPIPTLKQSVQCKDLVAGIVGHGKAL